MELLQILFINPYATKYTFFERNKSTPQSSLQNKKKSERNKKYLLEIPTGINGA